MKCRINFTDAEINSGFILKSSNKSIITPGGVEMVGELLKKTDLRHRINKVGKNAVNKVKKNFACVASMIGCFVQGKCNYEDVSEFHEDPSFYCKALRINNIPSVETLRQRFDELGVDLKDSELFAVENAKLLKAHNIKLEPTFTGHVPLDADVSSHDQSGIKKEGVSWTYQGYDGYSPMYLYCGLQGFLLNVQLREGSEHSQTAGTVNFFANSIKYAREITSEKLLFRLDSGNDSGDNIELFFKENVDFVIKRNLRKESREKWVEIAKSCGIKTTQRDGKIVYTGSTFKEKDGRKIRIVFMVTERTIDKFGQGLLEPQIDIQTWWVSPGLQTNFDDEIVKLYREHAICEQFHSEIKTDIGLERFPSGKFATNALILQIVMIAYNVLKIIGYAALNLGVKLTKHDVGRLRIKTVIQRFINIAVHVVNHARKTYLDFGKSNKWRDAFVYIHAILQ